MIFKAAAELIRRNLAGGDIPEGFQVEPEDIYVKMLSIIPFLIRKDFWDTYQLEQGLDETQFTTFTAIVQKSDGEIYVVLPSAPLMIYGRGTPEIFYTKDKQTNFTFIPSSQMRMFKDIDVTGEISGIIFTYENLNTGDGSEHRLIFTDLDKEVQKLKVKMIQSVDLETFNENDAIPIAPHLEHVLIEETRKWFIPQDARQEDKIVDDRNNKI